jgi:hypothetical protein
MPSSFQKVFNMISVSNLKGRDHKDGELSDIHSSFNSFIAETKRKIPAVSPTSGKKIAAVHKISVLMVATLALVVATNQSPQRSLVHKKTRSDCNTIKTQRNTATYLRSSDTSTTITQQGKYHNLNRFKVLFYGVADLWHAAVATAACLCAVKRQTRRDL